MISPRANDPRQRLLDAGVPGWTPDHLAELIVTLNDQSVSCGDVARSMVMQLEASAPSLRGAVVTIADRADQSGKDNAFHNPQHSRDVAVIWLSLALANNRLARANGASHRLTKRELLLGACAAFGHDLAHDGTSNNVPGNGSDGAERGTRVAFRLERLAADCVCEALQTHRADPAEVAAARAAVLTTDIVDGYAVLDAALSPAGLGDEAAPEFAPLRDPAVALLAVILRDADVLPSAGLTAREYDRNTALLEAELGIPRNSLGPVGTEEFFGRVLRGQFLSPPGKLFQSRLDTLRALNDVRLNREDLRTASLESVDRLAASA
jgi:hypothetical protein